VTLLPVISARNLANPRLESLSSDAREVLSEEAFRRMIAIERKRTERSKEPFLLMLLESVDDRGSKSRRGALDRAVDSLLPSTRETDVVGWYKGRTVAGVMYTGLLVKDKNFALSTIQGRVSATLRDNLTSDQISNLTLSFHFFPDDWDENKTGRPTNPALYPDLLSRENGRRSVKLMKRAMDVVGSAIMLILFAPLFLLVALAIKVSSKGPVLFRQQRVGLHGQRFTFLKFRSMRHQNDSTVHREYVTRFIANEAGHRPANTDGTDIYKLTNDDRVTRVGKLLRRTSIDEIPQFLNVLKGDMSLVGPRPPIAYELAVYQTWHRRRVLQVKPGITGLWQVTGRSRVKFDEMVRLDLRYATSWTPWLDLRILMKTPLAVVKGNGAC
jgi:lipopolysaccharide/colanic/teichoic acid biosynthesis glycosyltransferase